VIPAGDQTTGRVWVEIADTGSGIAPEHLPRIFDPFFTTKPVGKGTGLGLSLAWSIVKKHHGELIVESTPGVGTRFRMVLPVSGTPPEIQPESRFTP
jgi:signal transduction histidine kinase